jgi:hypothetical protein
MTERHITKITAICDLTPDDTEYDDPEDDEDDLDGRPVISLEEAKQSLIENACDDCVTWKVEWSDGVIEEVR